MASNAKSNGSARRAASNDAEPSELAHEAVAEWRLALRYAAAAAKPAMGRGIERVKERAAGAIADRVSLKDRLNPTTTTKGGRLGDAADAVLAKLGRPGKLAAKASLGSRAVDKLTPGQPSVDEHTEESTEPEVSEGAPSEIAEGESPEASAEGESPEGPDESERSEASGESDEAESPEDVQEEDPPGDADDESAVPAGQVEHKEIPSQYEHAYTEELQDYEHREAYATTGS